MAELFGTFGWDPLERVTAPESNGAGPSAAGPASEMRLFDHTDRRHGGGPAVGNFNRDQFTIFQFSPEHDGRPTELDEVKAAVAGSSAQPDVQLRLTLRSFHLGAKEDAVDAHHATIRMDLAQRDSLDRGADLLWWSAATALDLFEPDTRKRSAPKALSSDISRSFGPRPIEIPGGIGQFRFEVVAHENPPWLRRIFSRVNNPTAKALASTLGFPGIAFGAVELLDEFFDRLGAFAAKPLFQSRPLQLTFTAWAKAKETHGLANVHVAVLNPGLHLLCRHRDIATIRDSQPIYYTQFGLLAPKDMRLDLVGDPGQDGPFRNLTFAILEVESAQTSLKAAL